MVYSKFEDEIDKVCKVFVVGSHNNFLLKQLIDLSKCEKVTNFEDKYYEEMSKCNEIGLSLKEAMYSLSEFYDKEITQPSTQDRIINLKRQLKHCKSHVERLNIERELNRLYKEEKNEKRTIKRN